jgi:hypothetical protein
MSFLVGLCRDSHYRFHPFIGRYLHKRLQLLRYPRTYVFQLCDENCLTKQAQNAKKID